MAIKFKPCPQCGKDIELFTVRSNRYLTYRMFKCPDCGFSTPKLYGKVEEAINIWENFTSAVTCTYKSFSKNKWEYSLCHHTWTYSEGCSPMNRETCFCETCGARIKDYLDENGRSLKGGEAS